MERLSGRRGVPSLHLSGTVSGEVVRLPDTGMPGVVLNEKEKAVTTSTLLVILLVVLLVGGGGWGWSRRSR